MKSKKLSRLLKIQAVVFAVVVAAGACSVGAFAYNCSRVRSDVLRMHVIANSDSDGDQALKLKVRDAVLERGAELFDGTVTADEPRFIDYPAGVQLRLRLRRQWQHCKCDAERQVDGLHLRCAGAADSGQRPQRYPLWRKWHDVEVHLRPRRQHPEKGTLCVCRYDESSGNCYLRIRRRELARQAYGG